MNRAAVFTLSLLGVAVSSTAIADFHIEYPASVSSTERGLMGNRTHYEQKGEANFRMTDAERKPEQSKYTEAGHRMVVDLGYRVVTHHGSANNEYRVRTFANDVPLLNALGLVVPKGWQAYQHSELDPKRLQELVSFEGNLLWTDALVSIGDRYGYQFHVDWYERTVLVSQGRVTTEMEAANRKVIHEPPVEGARRKGAFRTWWDSKFGKGEATATPAPVPSPAPAEPAVMSAPVQSEPVEVQEDDCLCVDPARIKLNLIQTSWQTRTSKIVGDTRGILNLESSESDSGSFKVMTSGDEKKD